MAFIYNNPDSLNLTDKVGGGQCVRLLQHYIAGIGHTSTWRAGSHVVGNLTLAKGTAIATFVNGSYPNQAHGNHAAIYLSQNAGGIFVIDQWPDRSFVFVRHIPRLGKNPNGNFHSPSNNADAFSVIEHSQ